MITGDELVEKSRAYVIESFTKNGKFISRGSHLLETEKMLLEIKPDAGYELRVAALLHDIDSAFKEYFSENGFRDKDYLKAHQEGAAEVAQKFLLKSGATKDFATKVGCLIERHEVGGNAEQNLIMDADSISFFLRDFNAFIERHNVDDSSLQKIREKFDWMYDRISNDKNKELVYLKYQEALKILETK